MQLIPGVELAAFASPFIGKIESRKHLLRDVIGEMKLGSGLISVSGWIRRKKPVQLGDGCTGDHRVAELSELRRDNERNRDLLAHALKEIGESFWKDRNQSASYECWRVFG